MPHTIKSRKARRQSGLCRNLMGRQSGLNRSLRGMARVYRNLRGNLRGMARVRGMARIGFSFGLKHIDEVPFAR